ncbi:hypothetical protein V8F06_010883 [Rhypophila decipiens]
MGSHFQEPSTSPNVAIIGAGLTGLLAAQGLKKNGFSNITIYDRDSSPTCRPRDWTIVLHWAMPTFLDLLLPGRHQNKGQTLNAQSRGSEEFLAQALCNPNIEFSEYTESLVCYNGQTGDHLFSSHMKDSRRVSRQKLRNVLLQGLEAEGISVQWSKQLVEICQEHGTNHADEPLTLRFSDGSVTAGIDYVLGADGPSSKVRELLFQGKEEDAKLASSGFVMSSCLATYPDTEVIEKLVEKHPVASLTMSLHSVMGYGVMYAPNPDDKSTWTAFWHKIWKSNLAALPVSRTGQEALDYLKSTTTGLPEPFQSVIDKTPAGSPCCIDELKYWNPRPFQHPSGRVTLAGDAAHPMLPYRGQGYQHAVTDVRNFVDAMTKICHGGEDSKHTMAEYDSELVKRGSEAVMQALKEAELSMNPETVGRMLMVRKGHGKSA